MDFTDNAASDFVSEMHGAKTLLLNLSDSYYKVMRSLHCAVELDSINHYSNM